MQTSHHDTLPLLSGVDGRLALHEERIFVPAELRTVPVIECGEPLGIVQNRIPGILCRHVLPDTARILGSELMLCRSGVLERLREAASLIQRCSTHGVLPEGSQLVVGYAYRAPEVQAEYFEMAKAHVLKLRPGIDPAALEAEASKFVNPPDVAGHTAGAALDVTIADRGGREYDMGSKFLALEDEKRIPVFALKEVDPVIHERRLVLRDAMISAGFAPFAGEWWHFSYGDRDWAYYYRNPCAIYGPKSSAEAKDALAAALQ